LTWALILASARHLVGESNSIRAGGWQTSVGHELDGRILGVLGLGNGGGQVREDRPRVRYEDHYLEPEI